MVFLRDEWNKMFEYIWIWIGVKGHFYVHRCVIKSILNYVSMSCLSICIRCTSGELIVKL